MPSFRRYILKHIHDDTPAGDLARDFEDDTCAKGLSSYASIRKHMMKAHGACDGAMDALDELYVKFRADLVCRFSSKAKGCQSQ
jgi:hypothetical protein